MDITQRLRAVTGLDELTPSTDGHMEVLVDGQSIYVSLLDDEQVEISSRLQSFGSQCSDALVRALLIANGLFASQSIRFGMEDTGGIIFSRRFDARSGTEADFDAALTGFVALARAWQTRQAPALLATLSSPTNRALGGDEQVHAIRV